MRKLIFGLLGLATLGFGALRRNRPRLSPIIRAMAIVGPAVEYRYVPPPRPCRVQVRHPLPRASPPIGYGPAPVYRPVRAVRRCWVEPAARPGPATLGAPSGRGLPHGRRPGLANDS